MKKDSNTPKTKQRSSKGAGKETVTYQDVWPSISKLTQRPIYDILRGAFFRSYRTSSTERTQREAKRQQKVQRPIPETLPPKTKTKPRRAQKESSIMYLEIKARIRYDELEIRRELRELKESGGEPSFENISSIFLKHSNLSFSEAWVATSPPPKEAE